MKYVLFQLYEGVYAFTTQKNFDSYMRDERKITKLNGFESIDEAAMYLYMHTEAHVESLNILR